MFSGHAEHAVSLRLNNMLIICLFLTEPEPAYAYKHYAYKKTQCSDWLLISLAQITFINQQIFLSKVNISNDSTNASGSDVMPLFFSDRHVGPQLFFPIHFSLCTFSLIVNMQTSWLWLQSSKTKLEATGKSKKSNQL